MSVLASRSSAPTSATSGLGRPFVLVTGGKGGVGKSTIAANLAAVLGHAGARPLLVDLDFGLANLDVLLGVDPDLRAGAYLRGEATVRDCLLDTPYRVTLLPAGSSAGEEPVAFDPPARERLLDGLRAVAPDHGVVVGDSAAGIGPEVLRFAALADRVLVVTTPEPAALTDAYGVVKALDHWAREHDLALPTPELFVNFARDAEEAQRVVAGLRSACKRFLSRSPRLVGWMPRGRAVLRAILAQRPFVVDAPNAPATRQLTRLAHRWVDGLLATAPAPIAPEKGSQALDGSDR